MMTITINGTAYPCYRTMGALLMYKRHTGKQATEIGAGDVTAMLTYLWCQTVAACDAEGVEMPWDEQQFANRLKPEAFEAWCQSLVAETAGEATDGDGGESGGEKKS